MVSLTTLSIVAYQQLRGISASIAIHVFPRPLPRSVHECNHSNCYNYQHATSRQVAAMGPSATSFFFVSAFESPVLPTCIHYWLNSQRVASRFESS